MATENAKITDVFIGFEDHGIFTIYVHLEGDGWGQSFGGYSNSDGTFHVECLRRLLKTLDYLDVSQLKGKLCRISREIDSGFIEKIGHPIKNQWFNFRELAADFSEKK